MFDVCDCVMCVDETTVGSFVAGPDVLRVARQEECNSACHREWYPRGAMIRRELRGTGVHPPHKHEVNRNGRSRAHLFYGAGTACCTGIPTRNFCRTKPMGDLSIISMAAWNSRATCSRVSFLQNEPNVGFEGRFRVPENNASFFKLKANGRLLNDFNYFGECPCREGETLNGPVRSTAFADFLP